jgi:hypothetical protein
MFSFVSQVSHFPVQNFACISDLSNASYKYAQVSIFYLTKLIMFSQNHDASLQLYRARSEIKKLKATAIMIKQNLHDTSVWILFTNRNTNCLCFYNCHIERNKG